MLLLGRFHVHFYCFVPPHSISMASHLNFIPALFAQLDIISSNIITLYKHFFTSFWTRLQPNSSLHQIHISTLSLMLGLVALIFFPPLSRHSFVGMFIAIQTICLHCCQCKLIHPYKSISARVISYYVMQSHVLYMVLWFSVVWVEYYYSDYLLSFCSYLCVEFLFFFSNFSVRRNSDYHFI